MMKYKNYFGTVEFDPDAGILHGEVVGIRDVITFQGKSVREVTKAFKDSIDDYLDFCRQRNEEPEKPCSGQFVLRLPPDLHRNLANAAQVRRMSLNSFVKQILEEKALPSAATRRKPLRRPRGRNRRPSAKA